MFVEIRKKGKNKKYYLVHSFREGRKVIKIRRYLGLNLSDHSLNAKKMQAESFIKEQLKNYVQIRDPLNTMLAESELAQIKKLENKFSVKDLKVFHLTEKQWLKFSELFSYNTNAIEGSTLNQKEVVQLLEKNKLPDKNISDTEETRGVVEAISFIRKTKVHISLELIKKLHHIVFKKTKPFAGEFRAKGIEVVITDGLGNIVHRGSPAAKVTSLLLELVNWYAKNKKKYSPILLAAAVHNQFENIHPFQDGNGRAGRLLLNNILLKHNLPPVNIEFNRRQEYYKTLQSYERDGNIRPTIEFILKEYRQLYKKLKYREMR